MDLFLVIIVAIATVAATAYTVRAQVEAYVIFIMGVFALLETVAVATWLVLSHGWGVNLTLSAAMPFGVLFLWNFAMTECAYAVVVSWQKPLVARLRKKLKGVPALLATAKADGRKEG